MSSRVRQAARWAMGAALFSGGLLLMLLLYNGRTPPDADLEQPWLLNPDGQTWTGARRLKVVTYNVHDLYVVSDHREARMKAIGAALAKLDPDLVALQEAFVASDRAALLAALEGSRLHHSHYIRSGTVGSGLWVLSAYPIEGAVFHRFTRNGKWYKPWHGDWWAGKGVGLVRVEVAPQEYVDVYNTHGHAGYGSDEYDADLRVQMLEVASFVDATASPAVPGILAGDLNCRRGEGPFDALGEVLAFETLNDNLEGIDHILALSASGYRQTPSTVVVLDGALTDGGNGISWSDHDGYAVDIEVVPAASDSPVAPPDQVESTVDVKDVR